MKKDPTRFNKSYFADAPNKMLHSNKATDITVAYVNYCIPNILDWDFLSEEEEYTCPRDKKIVYWSYTGKDFSYYPPMPYKKYTQYTQKKFVAEPKYSGPKDHYF